MGQVGLPLLGRLERGQAIAQPMASIRILILHIASHTRFETLALRD